MTRIPVKFRESLNISESMKAFIKKCLEVDDTKRMSLNDLKDWLEGRGSHLKLGNGLSQREDNLPLRLNLTHKTTSTIDKIGMNQS